MQAAVAAITSILNYSAGGYVTATIDAFNFSRRSRMTLQCLTVLFYSALYCRREDFARFNRGREPKGGKGLGAQILMFPCRALPDLDNPDIQI